MGSFDSRGNNSNSKQQQPLHPHRFSKDDSKFYRTPGGKKQSTTRQRSTLGDSNPLQWPERQ